ncbi:MAG: glycosyltransferase family 39 protein [Phycisphaerae bacterium]
MNPNPLAKPPSRKAFWIIILIAFGLRLTALMVTTHIEPLLDERLYLQRAEALLNGEGFIGSYQSWVRHEGSPLMSDLPQYTGSYQPPFYTMFIAGIYAITGHSVFAVKFAQVILSTVTVGLVYWIACAWFDRKSAPLATYCAIYPNLIAFSPCFGPRRYSRFWSCSRWIAHDDDGSPVEETLRDCRRVAGVRGDDAGGGLYFIPVFYSSGLC